MLTFPTVISTVTELVNLVNLYFTFTVFVEKRFLLGELEDSNSLRVRLTVFGLTFKQAQTRSIIAVCGKTG
jgi:hypothetical protein